MEIELIWTQNMEDEDGYAVKTQEYSRCIFAEEKSVARNEFYEAMRSGIKVKRIFEVRKEDFELSRHRDEAEKVKYAEYAVYEGERYRIIKAYGKGKSKVELACGEDECGLNWTELRK